jgi:hypothetical protein
LLSRPMVARRLVVVTTTALSAVVQLPLPHRVRNFCSPWSYSSRKIIRLTHLILQLEFRLNFTHHVGTTGAASLIFNLVSGKNVSLFPRL